MLSTVEPDSPTSPGVRRPSRPSSPGEWSRPDPGSERPTFEGIRCNASRPSINAGLGLGYGFAGSGPNFDGRRQVPGEPSISPIATPREAAIAAGQEQAALMAWLEKEVVAKLSLLDQKLDLLQESLQPHKPSKDAAVHHTPSSRRKPSKDTLRGIAGYNKPSKDRPYAQGDKDRPYSQGDGGKEGPRQEHRNELTVGEYDIEDLRGAADETGGPHGLPVRPDTAIVTPPHEVQEILDVDDEAAVGAKRGVDVISIGSNSTAPGIDRMDSATNIAKYRRDGSQASCALLEEKTLHRRESEVKLWSFLSDPESGKHATRWSIAMPAVTMIAVFVTLLQSYEPPIIYGTGAAIAEVSFEVFFALELFIRFVVCPSRVKFVMDVHNWIDLLAVLPICLRAAIGWILIRSEGEYWSFQWWSRNLLIAVVPILRILRTLRRFERFKLVGAAFEQAGEALPILLFTLFVLTLIFSALIFLVEPRDNIESLQRAAWLTIVTMTTVGYGDVVPVSSAGNIVVTVLVITSVLYMAMPLGIVGQAFKEVWNDRDRLLLVLRTKQRLKEWGYTARDVLVLFRWFDEDGSGELDVDEFHSMVDQMKLGLSRKRVVELFKSIDLDQGGSVDAKEFVKYLFPEDFYEIYGHDDDDGDHDDDDDSEEQDGEVVPEAAAAIAPGVLVQIQGLKSREEFNFKMARVISFDEKTKRWECELLGGMLGGGQDHARLQCKADHLYVMGGQGGGGHDNVEDEATAPPRRGVTSESGDDSSCQRPAASRECWGSKGVSGVS